MPSSSRTKYVPLPSKSDKCGTYDELAPDALLAQSVRLLAHRYSGALPFSDGDVTAGVETELQAVVIAPREKADLPLAIENSGFFRNIRKRMATGEMSR